MCVCVCVCVLDTFNNQTFFTANTIYRFCPFVS